MQSFYVRLQYPAQGKYKLSHGNLSQNSSSFKKYKSTSKYEKKLG
jgi:hypothetical protein